MSYVTTYTNGRGLQTGDRLLSRQLNYLGTVTRIVITGSIVDVSATGGPTQHATLNIDDGVYVERWNASTQMNMHISETDNFEAGYQQALDWNRVGAIDLYRQPCSDYQHGWNLGLMRSGTYVVTGIKPGPVYTVLTVNGVYEGELVTGLIVYVNPDLPPAWLEADTQAYLAFNERGTVIGIQKPEAVTSAHP